MGTLRMGADRRSVVTVCFSSAAPLLAAAILLTGCSSEFAVLECQQLSEETAQYLDVQMDVENVWQTICANVGRDPACRELSRSNSDHLVSWYESVENWRDFGQDALLVARMPPFAGLASRRAMEKQAKKGLDKLAQPGIGITTVWVQPRASGCRVNIRRTYYGPGSVAGLNHSRGDYERDLWNRMVGPRGTPRTRETASSEGATR